MITKDIVNNPFILIATFLPYFTMQQWKQWIINVLSCKFVEFSVTSV